MLAARSATRGRATVALALLTAAALLSACGYGYSSSSRDYVDSPRYPAASGHPTPAQQAATLHANQGYRHELLVSAQGLTSALGALQRAASAGDLGAARRDELAAQAAYDVLRGEIEPGSATANLLDGEAWSTPDGKPSGLHAIERDLWHRVDLASAARRAHRLGAESLMTGFVLFRINRTPMQMLATVQGQLSWAVATPIAGREEAYSRLDAVDVLAISRHARRVLMLVVPLGRLVAPGLTSACAARARDLDRALGELGAPGARTDEEVPTSTWRRVASAIDALDASLGSLGGALAGFGSGRVYA